MFIKSDNKKFVKIHDMIRTIINYLDLSCKGEKSYGYLIYHGYNLSISANVDFSNVNCIVDGKLFFSISPIGNSDVFIHHIDIDGDWVTRLTKLYDKALEIKNKKS